MRIHAITIDNFRAIEHLELKDLPDTGVVVIHGCNEAGKSTILDALDLVLRERHTAGGKKIKVYAPAGRDEGPEVTLAATVGEYTFTIHKRWLKQKLSELTVTAPTPRNFTGREADDELERILGSSMDTDLAQTLFLRQGELEPGIAAAGIPSISRALDAQNGGGSRGEEDSALAAAIDAEYAKYWTNATPPKEKAAYKALFAAEETARDELARHQSQVQELAGFVDEVARREEDIARVEEELPQAREEVQRREGEYESAKRIQSKVDEAAQTHLRAAEALERAREDRAARKILAQRVEDVEVERADLGAKLEPAVQARDAEREKVAELGTAVDNAKHHVIRAREDVARAEMVRDYVRGAARTSVLRDHIARIEEAEEAYTELLNAAPAREVTDADVRAIEQAENEVTLQRRLREAASAKLDISVETPAVIDVDGEERAIEGTETVPVLDGTEIALGAFRVTYRAALGAKDPSAAVEDAERALANALAAASCDTLAEAREARDATNAHAAEVKAAKQRRDDALAGADAGELQAELSRWDIRLQELAEAHAARVAEADETAALPVAADGLGEDDAEAALKAAQKQLTSAERDVEAAEAALKPYADRAASNALMVLEARIEGKDAELENAKAQLATEEGKRSTADLDAAIGAAEQASEEATEALRAAEQELGEADPALAEQLLEGASARLLNLEQRRADAKNRITELTGRIELATGAAEQADRAAAALEAAETELARTRRRAEAVKLLHTTMVKHRDAARARYTAPFTEAIRNRARVLFGPTVDFTLADDLTLSARTVDGVTVALSELSGGTKEQLALLTRFAIADLVTESGSTTPVPVVVDDALGATDPDRLARMNSLFSQVGKTSQVFVLTCFPQRFDRVAAARTIDIDELKA